MYCNYILQLCSILLFGHWPYSVYLYICTWLLAINFADMPINILSLSLSFVNLYNTSAKSCRMVVSDRKPAVTSQPEWW